MWFRKKKKKKILIRYNEKQKEEIELSEQDVRKFEDSLFARALFDALEERLSNARDTLETPGLGLEQTEFERGEASAIRYVLGFPEMIKRELESDQSTKDEEQ